VGSLAPTGLANKLIQKKIDDLTKSMKTTQSAFERSQTELLSQRERLDKERADLVVKESNQNRSSGSAINRVVNLFKDSQQSQLSPIQGEESKGAK